MSTSHLQVFWILLLSSLMVLPPKKPTITINKNPYYISKEQADVSPKISALKFSHLPELQSVSVVWHMQNEKVHHCSVIGFLKRENLHLTFPFWRMNLERFLSWFCSGAQEGNMKECWRKPPPQVPPFKGGRDANLSLLSATQESLMDRSRVIPKPAGAVFVLMRLCPILSSTLLCFRMEQETAPNPHILKKMSWKLFKQKEI